MPTNTRAGRLLAVAVAAAAVAVGATGCGGGGSSSTQASTSVTTVPPAAKVQLGKKAYVHKMQVLGNQLGKTVNGLYPLSSGSKGSATAKQTVIKLQKAQAVIDGVLAQLMRIVPPPAVAKEHRQLVSGVHTLSDQLGSMITNTETGDIGDFVAGSNFTAPLRTINAAASAMTSLGYNVIGKASQTNP